MRQVAVLSLLHPATFLSRFLGLAFEENFYSKLYSRRKGQTHKIDETGTKENELKIDIDVFPFFGNLSTDNTKHILKYHTLFNL